MTGDVELYSHASVCFLLWKNPKGHHYIMGPNVSLSWRSVLAVKAVVSFRYTLRWCIWIIITKSSCLLSIISQVAQVEVFSDGLCSTFVLTCLPGFVLSAFPQVLWYKAGSIWCFFLLIVSFGVSCGQTQEIHLSNRWFSESWDCLSREWCIQFRWHFAVREEAEGVTSMAGLGFTGEAWVLLSLSFTPWAMCHK